MELKISNLEKIDSAEIEINSTRNHSKNILSLVSLS